LGSDQRALGDQGHWAAQRTRVVNKKRPANGQAFFIGKRKRFAA
jgi:hypothetical protein